MKINFKKIIAFVAVFALLLQCCACTGKKEKADNGKIQISIAGYDLTDPQQKELFENKKAAFEKEHPNVEVTADAWTFDLETFYAKAAAGLLPTLFSSYYSELKLLAQTGYVADITSVADELGLIDQMNPLILEILSDDGKLYGLPESSYMNGLAYVPELLEAAGYINEDGTPHQPKDWYEVAEMAQKIKKATGKDGFILPTTGNNGGWLFTNIAWSFGASFMENKNGSWKATIDSKECQEALQFVKDLRWEYDVLPHNIIVSRDDWTKGIGTKTVAMAFGNSSMPSEFAKFGAKPDDYGTMAIPAGPEGRYSLVGGAVKLISAKATPEQIKACIEWLNCGKVTETSKESFNVSIQKKLDNGTQVGLQTLQSWNDDVEETKFKNDTIKANANAPENLIKLYNDSLTDKSITLHAEEPLFAQELYALLDGCLQTVIKDKDADVREVLKEANKNFQEQYLDTVKQ